MTPSRTQEVARQIQRVALACREWPAVIWWHAHNGMIVGPAAETRKGNMFSFRGLFFDVTDGRRGYYPAALRRSGRLAAISFYDLTAARATMAEALPLAVLEAAERKLQSADGIPWHIHAINNPRARKIASKAFLDEID